MSHDVEYSRAGAPFAEIASRYWTISNRLAMGQFGNWHRAALNAMALDSSVSILDVGCGTGQFLRSVAQSTGRGDLLTGLDPEPAMLSEARRLASSDAQRRCIRWVRGFGECLPFPDATFDRVTAQFSLRNMNDWHRGLSEMIRVLRPSGRLIVLEMVRPETLKGWLGVHYLEAVTRLPGITPFHVLPKTVPGFESARNVMTVLKASSVNACTCRKWVGGLVVLIVAGAAISANEV